MVVKVWAIKSSYGQSGVISSSGGTSYGSGRIGITFDYCHGVY